jgi:hypothetical protein
LCPVNSAERVESQSASRPEVCVAANGQTLYDDMRLPGRKEVPMLRQSEIEEGEARRTNASMGLIVILLLAIAGVLLVRELREKGRIEDCLMAGRHNCVPIEIPAHHPD